MHGETMKFKGLFSLNTVTFKIQFFSAYFPIFPIKIAVVAVPSPVMPRWPAVYHNLLLKFGSNAALGRILMKFSSCTSRAILTH